jgi:hypothetical protein
MINSLTKLYLDRYEISNFIDDPKLKKLPWKFHTLRQRLTISNQYNGKPIPV